MYLCDFHSIEPPLYKSQSDCLEWLVKAYTQSQSASHYTEEDYRKIIYKVACSESHIHQRGFFLEEVQDTDWAQKEVYSLLSSPKGAGTDIRQTYYNQISDHLFENIYTNRRTPEDIIHITCTGYQSPSAAQKIAAKISSHITVTHSYHMGCYGAFPALRMACGFLSNPAILGKKHRIDLVHTEICSLHMSPQDPPLEQMVIQSLFADGCIAYTMTDQRPLTGFRIHSLHEGLIPDTSQAMEWATSEFGMRMVLSKDVPHLVGQNIRQFISDWVQSLSLDVSTTFQNAIFAIHPGGPKIIDQVQEHLQLRSDQLEFSRRIFHQRGNMSSATIPHLWEELLKNPLVPAQVPIISMAFGPGLTVCLSLMEKLP